VRCVDRDRVWWRFGKPNSDLPFKKRINTELFFDGKYELYIHKRRIRNSWPDLLERDTNSWLERQNMREWKPIMVACLKWGTTMLWMRTCKGSLFEMTLSIAIELKYCKVKVGCKTDHWAYVTINIIFHLFRLCKFC